MIDIKEKLMSVKLDDDQYEAMLLSYLLKLTSFELTRKNINAELSKKENVSDEDLSKMKSIESYISDTIRVIDSFVFTPCLIHYFRKYRPEDMDLILNDKSKVIISLNEKAKKAIEQEADYFGLNREVKDEEEEDKE